MPVDAMGNRADVIMDDLSTIKRMNPGRLFEQYINASAKAVSTRIATSLRTDPVLTEERIEGFWQYLTGFYKIVSPRMHAALIASGGENRKKQHIEDVAKNGIYLFLPTDNPVSYVDVVRKLREEYPATYGPVTYRGKSGKMVTTKHPVLIGGLYMILLEKIGNTWAGVHSAKLQPFGIPAKLTNADKYSSPGRQQPVKILGESEVRLIAATCGGDIVADLLDQTNNPKAHRAILKEVLTNPVPTNVPKIINRQEIPPGKGRILTYLNHMLECGGMRFVKGSDGC